MDNDGTIGILDLGTEEQKAKLYRIEELIDLPQGEVALGPTDPSKWKIWPRRDQANSGSCVYQARAKAAGILREQISGEFVEYSAADYAVRSNRPHAGSYPVEAFDFWRERGMGLEALEPSQHMDDSEMDTLARNSFEAEVAKLSRIPNYVALTPYNFDIMLATLKATGKPIPFGLFATSKEWKRDIPTILEPNLSLMVAPVRHMVCATPNFGIYQGQEGFTCEDSWGGTGIEGRGVRWITREFFNKRNYIPGLYATTFKSYSDIGELPTKPKVHLTMDLEFGMQHPDVRKLQEVYRYEGTFPANHAGSDYFHNITLGCTQKFQLKYGIAGPGDGGFGRVGPKTRAKINSLYS